MSWLESNAHSVNASINRFSSISSFLNAKSCWFFGDKEVKLDMVNCFFTCFFGDIASFISANALKIL